MVLIEDVISVTLNLVLVRRNSTTTTFTPLSKRSIKSAKNLIKICLVNRMILLSRFY